MAHAEHRGLPVGLKHQGINNSNVLDILSIVQTVEQSMKLMPFVKAPFALLSVCHTYLAVF
jgi:hypothetical protein